jgi:threonine aldolase
VLSFGATKNGALAAEAVVFFNRELAQSMRYRRRRGGHLYSKMRFLSVQLEAFIENDLWLRNARHANAMAQRVREGLAKIPGVRFASATEINLVLVALPQPVWVGLVAEGSRAPSTRRRRRWTRWWNAPIGMPALDRRPIVPPAP